ncbi:helix-turn-helix domain-containing protein [Aquimarina sp. AU58]|uniref:helix-turn-helix domain-containing protein n=1 Tax=Aquimarina sp. AU58 TaxID=1874112 RepID=UPI000D6E95CF
MSKKLNINSQVFNKVLKNKGILLSEIIYNYRINHFLSKLQSNQDETHTHTFLVEDNGFKSRATFYRIFKKNMNMSPTKYKEQIIKNS